VIQRICPLSISVIQQPSFPQPCRLLTISCEAAAAAAAAAAVDTWRDLGGLLWLVYIQHSFHHLITQV